MDRPGPAAGAHAGRRGGEGKLSALLFVLLAALTLAAFAITRAARAGDDLVNSVELSPAVEPGAGAEVAFTLAEGDEAVDVLIIEGDPGSDREQVRALALRAPLGAGRHEFSWDGTADDGERAPPGLYAIRVILGEADRDILPPGRIRVPAGGG